MKHVQNHLLFCCFFLLFGGGCSLSLSAQQVTEALQKQIWPAANTWSLDAWENALPDQNQDTIFHSSMASAEVVQLDQRGYPEQVVLLHKIDSHWQAVSKTLARFDHHGRLVNLQTWAFTDGVWVNESLAKRALAASGEVLTFEIQYWVEGSWQEVYSWEAKHLSGHLPTPLGIILPIAASKHP
jgi:hypothetical protein